jgi:hypothetical protein
MSYNKNKEKQSILWNVSNFKCDNSDDVIEEINKFGGNIKIPAIINYNLQKNTKLKQLKSINKLRNQS